MIEAVHEQGARIAVQLWHGNELKGEPVAPSVQGPCRAITREEIQMVVGKFATAALHCREAGFDGVEIHGAHGYFINQFFSPLTNQRKDDYGGGVEKRRRMALELVSAMRRAAGDKKTIFRSRNLPPRRELTRIWRAGSRRPFPFRSLRLGEFKGGLWRIGFLRRGRPT